MLWNYFHIRRRWLDIWTHADSSVSSALLSNMSSTPWKAFSLFSSINFGWGRLRSSFFFCWFLVQHKTLVNRSHTRKATYLKTKCQFILPLEVQKASTSFLQELKYFRQYFYTSRQNYKIFLNFPLRHLLYHWQSIHRQHSLVRPPQSCARTATPHSFIHKLGISCLHHCVLQSNILLAIHNLLSVYHWWWKLSRETTLREFVGVFPR